MRFVTITQTMSNDAAWREDVKHLASVHRRGQAVLAQSSWTWSRTETSQRDCSGADTSFANESMRVCVGATAQTRSHRQSNLHLSLRLATAREANVYDTSRSSLPSLLSLRAHSLATTLRRLPKTQTEVAATINTHSPHLNSSLSAVRAVSAARAAVSIALVAKAATVHSSASSCGR